MYEFIIACSLLLPTEGNVKQLEVVWQSESAKYATAKRECDKKARAWAKDKRVVKAKCLTTAEYTQRFGKMPPHMNTEIH